jgi:UDP-N-acetylglucosamine 1-carboxyvinyltransferase
VDDLIAFLREMGAEVERTAPDTIEVEGRRRLRGAEHRVVSDRIEAGTFVVAAAITGGEITLTGAPSQHLGAFMDVLADVGVDLTGDDDRLTVRATDPERLRAVDITTAPYPGLATDLQSPTAVLLTQAHGTSRIHETIFEDRLEWMDELRRMGAAVEIPDTHHALLHGPSRLQGAEVEMSDLRAGASLMLAALAADGESVIHGAHQVRRGYENIEGKFLDLGASIEVLSEGPSSVSPAASPVSPVPAAS